MSFSKVSNQIDIKCHVCKGDIIFGDVLFYSCFVSVSFPLRQESPIKWCSIDAFEWKCTSCVVLYPVAHMSSDAGSYILKQVCSNHSRRYIRACHLARTIARALVHTCAIQIAHAIDRTHK